MQALRPPGSLCWGLEEPKPPVLPFSDFNFWKVVLIATPPNAPSPHGQRRKVGFFYFAECQAASGLGSERWGYNRCCGSILFVINAQNSDFGHWSQLGPQAQPRGPLSSREHTYPYPESKLVRDLAPLGD